MFQRQTRNLLEEMIFQQYESMHVVNRCLSGSQKEEAKDPA